MDFSQQLGACVKQADQVLGHFITPLLFQNVPMVEITQYGALLGDKCLQPSPVRVISHMFGVNINTLDAPAAVVEYTHVYSLIHGDLPTMDDDDPRRGLSICHVRSGEANAVLAGDALQTLTFSILGDTDVSGVSDRDRILMVSELVSIGGTAGMCGGQALDLGAEGKHIPPDASERIHRRETGALIRVAIRLDALSARDKGRNALPVLDKHTESIDFVFQAQDDILDTVGDTAALGKHQGADRQLGKSTYPTPLGLEQARKKVQDLIGDVHQSLRQLTGQSLDISALGALTGYIIQRNK